MFSLVSKITPICRLLLALPFLFAVTGGEALAAEEPIHHVSSETCQLCHTEVYKQWKGSIVHAGCQGSRQYGQGGGFHA